MESHCISSFILLKNRSRHKYIFCLKYANGSDWTVCSWGALFPSTLNLQRFCSADVQRSFGHHWSSCCSQQRLGSPCRSCSAASSLPQTVEEDELLVCSLLGGVMSAGGFFGDEQSPEPEDAASLPVLPLLMERVLYCLLPPAHGQLPTVEGCCPSTFLVLVTC